MQGSTLGPYQVLDKLGSGGMGEVYVAEDTRLGRRVALKVLSSGVAASSERVDRFEREARVVAALNHPNIVTLHSIETSGETRFLTMELVEGRTLDEVVPRDGLSLDAFFRFAIPLAEAVAAAHRGGVTHRDLKPTNVMVGDDGRVKVLDFGLAKLRESADSGDPGELLTVLDTGEGKLLGTVAYMSPEQAEGRAADARSDIFALGVIFYEMLQGRRPFVGGSPASILSSILRDVPAPVGESRREVPRQLDRILAFCLAKEPDRRYQSALDLRNALEALQEEMEAPPEEQEAAGAPPTLRDRLPGLAAAGLAGAALTWSALQVGPGVAPGTTAPRGAGAPIDLTPVSREGTLSDYPSWSPDGRWLLFSSDRGGSMDLWRIEIGGGAPEQLTDTRFDEGQPVWSPAGGRIAYVASPAGEPAIYLVSEDGGGRPTRLWTPANHPVWSPDGRRIAFDWAGDVSVIEAAAGALPVPVVTDTAGSPYAVWSADGDALYLWNWVEGDVQMAPIEDGPPQSLGLVPTGEEVVGLAVAPGGDELLMSRGQYGGHKDLWSVPLVPGSGLPAGDPVRLTHPFTDDRSPVFSPDGSRVAFAARQIERHLWDVALDPTTGLALEPRGRQLTWAAPQNYYPSVSADGARAVWTAHPGVQGFLYAGDLGAPDSHKVTSLWGRGNREVGGSFGPDGEQIVYASPADGSYELWRVDCVQCVPLPMTSTEPPVRDSMPAWAPDGTRIAFMSTRAGNWDLWSLEVAAGATPRRLTQLDGAELYPVWAPDASRIAFRSQQSTGTDLWQISAAGGEPEPLVEAPGQEAWGAWSPDGARFYFTSNRSGPFNVWMRDADGALTRITEYDGLSMGLPDAALYTKFAVTTNRLVLPLEQRSGEIWLLERRDR